MKWRANRTALLLGGLPLIAIQLVPVERVNRPGAGHPNAPPEVHQILQRACYDCHSTETEWPAWAYVAPMSWLVARDVNDARARLNFSDWVEYERDLRLGLRSLVGPVTAVHRMPLERYLVLHPDARLAEGDIAALTAWSANAGEER